MTTLDLFEGLFYAPAEVARMAGMLEFVEDEELATKERLLEVPKEALRIARAVLTHDREFEFFVITVDQMRGGKHFGVNISTRALDAALGDKARKRIKRCLKMCIEAGVIVCDDKFRPATVGNPGFSKRYCIAPHQVRAVPDADVSQDVAAEDVEVALLSNAVPLLAPARAIRLVNPAYVRMDVDTLTYHRNVFAAGAAKLGWDATPQNVSNELRPSLQALETPFSDVDAVVYYQGREFRKQKTKYAIDRKTGLRCKKKAPTSREELIERLQLTIRKLNHGDVSATRLNGRIYHTVTSLPSTMRQQCQFRMPDGSLQMAMDVDVSAMHWNILISWMPASEEKELLMLASAEGKLYDLIKNACIGEGAFLMDDELTDKSIWKKRVSAFLLFCDRPGGDRQRLSIWKAFKRRYPGLAGVLWCLHSNYTLRQASFALTRVEGQVTLDRVMRRMHWMGLPCIPMHDGCLVPSGAVEICVDEYKYALEEVLGFVPLVRTSTMCTDALDQFFDDGPMEFYDDEFEFTGEIYE